MLKRIPKMVYADAKGNIYDHPDLCMAGMNGTVSVLPDDLELIPLPEDSRLFTMPSMPPIAWDARKKSFVTLSETGKGRNTQRVQAVAAFMAPGYVRTLLPACDYADKTEHLPLWSYTAVGWDEERDCFVVAASKVDSNSNWNPVNYDDRTLDPLVRQMLKEMPDNRLLEQLSRCAVDYHCFAAKNLFYRRWEAPLPTSPVCNSACLGCISLQPSEGGASTHAGARSGTLRGVWGEMACPHLEQAERAIVSYGQGCEGDPILQADTIAEATRRMKQATSRGTVNFNSNGSIPERVQLLCDAGMDSFRFSLNSVREDLYNRYYRPKGYTFSDVVRSIRCSKENQRFTMINYLVSPGVSDAPEEVETLLRFVADTGIDMIQMRNLSIDPEYYNREMGVDGKGIGMYRLMQRLKEEFPRLQFGYYNRTRENFFPDGFENGWPVRE